MRYTLWSRGRLVGESDLSYASGDDNLRHGHFIPSDDGAKLMPAATEVQAAAKALARAARRVASDGASRYESLSEYADMMAAIHRRAALSLELRDDTGCTIETDWIDIRDIDVQSLDDEFDEEDYESFDDDPEFQAAVEHDKRLIEEWFDANENTEGRYAGPAFDPNGDSDDWFEPVEPWKRRDDDREHHWYQITVMLRGGDRKLSS